MAFQIFKNNLIIWGEKKGQPCVFNDKNSFFYENIFSKVEDSKFAIKVKYVGNPIYNKDIMIVHLIGKKKRGNSVD